MRINDADERRSQELILGLSDSEADELVATPGIGQFVPRAKFGEELKAATAVA